MFGAKSGGSQLFAIGSSAWMFGFPHFYRATSNPACQSKYQIVDAINIPNINPTIRFLAICTIRFQTINQQTNNPKTQPKRVPTKKIMMIAGFSSKSLFNCSPD
jgi:hypothetical protein